MELVAALVNSLAWPASVAVIVIVLRHSILKRLGEQFDRATKFSMGAGSWQIAMEMTEQIRQEQAAELPQQDIPQVEEEADKIDQILDIDPEAALVMATANVELAAREASRRVGLIGERWGKVGGFGGRILREHDSLRSYAQALREHEHVSESVADGLALITRLRNQAVHKMGPVSRAEASIAITLAREIERALWQIAPRETESESTAG